MKHITEKIVRFISERNFDSLHNPKNLSMSIAIEAGELMEIFQFLNITESWYIENDDKEYEHVKEEIADVMIYCLSMCHQLNIDPDEAILSKIKKNEKKYPILR